MSLNRLEFALVASLSSGTADALPQRAFFQDRLPAPLVERFHETRDSLRGIAFPEFLLYDDSTEIETKPSMPFTHYPLFAQADDVPRRVFREQTPDAPMQGPGGTERSADPSFEFERLNDATKRRTEHVLELVHFTADIAEAIDIDSDRELYYKEGKGKFSSLDHGWTNLLFAVYLDYRDLYRSSPPSYQQSVALQLKDTLEPELARYERFLQRYFEESGKPPTVFREWVIDRRADIEKLIIESNISIPAGERMDRLLDVDFVAELSKAKRKVEEAIYFAQRFYDSTYTVQATFERPIYSYLFPELEKTVVAFEKLSRAFQQRADILARRGNTEALRRFQEERKAYFNGQLDKITPLLRKPIGPVKTPYEITLRHLEALRVP